MTYIEYNISELCDRSNLKNEKFEEFKKLVLPLNFEKGPWLAGGCLRSLLAGEEISDFDIFFSDREQRENYEKQLSDLGFELQNSSVASGRFEKNGLVVNTVHLAYHGSAKEVIDSFDFTICQLVTDGYKLLVGEYTLWDIARKRLILHRLSYGVSTVRRMLKYTKKGYRACSGCIGSILEAVSDDRTLIRWDIQYID